MVLKLDFRKAFDTVSWQALFKILSVRGSDETWRMWMHNLLYTSKTAILLNGIPGKWIELKRGLRQGDPLSPLLFILVVGVFQQTIRKFAGVGALNHPIFTNQPCHVLQ